MKKITLFLMLILALIIVPGAIFAAEGDVAEVGGTGYTTFELAYAEVTDTNNEIKLLNNVTLANTVAVNKNVIINLNNFNITGGVDPLFEVSNGSIEVKGNGTITGSKDVFYLVGNTVLNGDAIKAEVKIGANVEVVSETSNCIYLKGKGAKADVYGSLKTSSVEYAAIQGNGIKKENVDNGNTVINIYEGASVVATNDLAIYHPQSGVLNVYGGYIQGTTGIEMRAGTLTVTGGEIIGTWAPSSSAANASGSTTLGAGIALSQHSTTQDTKVIVKDGIIKGYTALFQGNAQGNNEEAVDKVSIEISGGKFEVTDGGTEAIHSENKTGFITGGTFTSDVSGYVSSDLGIKIDEKGNFVTAKKYNININTPENGIITVNKTEATEGEEITVTLTPNEGYMLRSVEMSYSVAIQKNYEETFKFIMPNENVEVTAIFEKVKENITIEAEVPSEIENIEKVEEDIIKSLKEMLKKNTNPMLRNRNLKARLTIVDWNKENLTDLIDMEKENFESAVDKINSKLNITSRFVHIIIQILDADTNEHIPLYEELINVPLTYKMSLPEEELPKLEEGYKREYYIVTPDFSGKDIEYKILDTKVLEDEKNNIEFSTDVIGLFNIAYTDVKEEIVTPPEDNDDNTDDDSIVTPPTGDEGATGEGETGGVEPEDKPVDGSSDNKETSKEENIDNSETGDNVVIYAVFAVVAMVGMVVTIKMRKK